MMLNVHVSSFNSRYRRYRRIFSFFFVFVEGEENNNEEVACNKLEQVALVVACYFQIDFQQFPRLDRRVLL